MKAPVNDGGSHGALSRLKLLGVEMFVGLVLLLALVIFLLASNMGSSSQGLLLWMAIILVALSIAGVEILLDIRRLSQLND